MKKALGYLGGILLLAVLCAVLLPGPTAQLTNALTRAALQAQNFVLTGSWDMSNASHMKLRRATSAPVGCTVGDFYFNSVSNNWWYCATADTWTTIASGNFANPYTPNQAFSGIVDFTGTVNLNRQQTVEVCKAGCGYSTVTAALSSITDADVTKRYVVLIHPGDYDENVTALSYVTLRGMSRDRTRLRGSSGTALTVPVGITEFAIDSITIGGVTAIALTGAESGRTVLRMYRSVLGIIDGSESAAGKTTTCLLDSGNKHDVFGQEVECRSTNDGFRIGTDDMLGLSGGRADLDDKGASNNLRVFSTSDTGAQMSINGMLVTMLKSAPGAGGTGKSGAMGVEYNVTTNTGTRPSILTFQGVSFQGTVTGTPTSNNIACLNLASTLGTQQASSRIQFLDVDCDGDGGTSAWSMRGISTSTNDTDWATVPVRWVGGSIRARGSGSHFDVFRSLNPSGTVVDVVAVAHSGTYSGQGPTTAPFPGKYAPSGNWTPSAGTWDFTATTVILPYAQIKNVCKSGCQYSTVNAAMTAITDSSITKRYLINVGPGDYQESTILLKPYIAISGSGTEATFFSDTVFTESALAGGSPGIVLQHFTAGRGSNGVVLMVYDQTAAPTTMVLYDVVLGMHPDSAGAYTDNCIVDTGAGHNFYFIESACRTNLEAFYVRADNNWVDIGSRVEFVQLDPAHAGENTEVWTAGQQGGAPVALSMTNGATIYSQGLRVTGTFDPIDVPPLVSMLDMQGSTGTTYGPLHVSINNATFDLTTADAAAWPINVVTLGAVGANASASLIELNNVVANISATAGTHPINGINITATDADHANYTIRVNGGLFNFSSAGGALTDVVNSDGTGGFVVQLSNLLHAGNYSGTTAPTFGDTASGKFSKNLTLPTVASSAVTASGAISYDTTANALEYGDNGTNRTVANLDEAQTFSSKTLTTPIISSVDLVVGTCTAGWIAIDSGGATKEWCACGTTNTWGCWKLTDGTFNANGPAD